MTACAGCGSTRRERQWSNAAKATVCIACHLRVAPPTKGTDRELLDLAAELRRDADDLARVAEDRSLKAIAQRLAAIPLLLEVRSEKPIELVRDAGRLRGQAMRLLKAGAR